MRGDFRLPRIFYLREIFGKDFHRKPATIKNGGYSKMKKITAIFLSLSILIAIFCGCSQKLTKEEMLEKSEKVTVYEISNTIELNVLRAKHLYCGKHLEITGEISKIYEDFFVFKSNSLTFKVYLDEDELIDLNNQQYVTVVGKTSNKIKPYTEKHSGYEKSLYNITMKNAYLVESFFNRNKPFAHKTAKQNDCSECQRQIRK